VSEEVVFGLRKGNDFPPYLVLGFALNSNSCIMCNIDKNIIQSK